MVYIIKEWVNNNFPLYPCLLMKKIHIPGVSYVQSWVHFTRDIQLKSVFDADCIGLQSNYFYSGIEEIQ